VNKPADTPSAQFRPAHQVESSDPSQVNPIDAGRIAICDRVVEIAGRSQSRDEFLRSVAQDVRSHFGSAIVAISASHWSRPIMLVADDLLAAQVDRTTLSDLLSTATFNAVSCSLALSSPTSSGQKTVRALRIELTAMPERSAILVVYPADAQVDGLTQLSDLKTIRVYAEACRDVSAQAASVVTTPSQSRSGELLASSLASPDRHSLRLFHRDLDVAKTAYRIANESRRILGCDRVSVLTLHGSQWRVAAVSGVAVVDRRSNAIRSLEHLVKNSIVMARPLILPSIEPLPPQVEEPVDDYLDQSGIQSAAILPLYEPDTDAKEEGVEAARIDPFHGHGKAVAVMVLENFSGKLPSVANAESNQSLIVSQESPGRELINPATIAVAGEAMLAMRNSLQHHRVFALPVAQALGNAVSGRRLPWMIAGTLVIAGLAIASMVITTEHYVVASGSLQPEVRRDVFAGLDGTVKEIMVQDGQLVTKGTPMLRLENAELESQAESLVGKIQTAQQRLSSLSSLMLSDSGDDDSAGRMSIEQRQLESELKDLQTQSTIVQEQQKDLIIVSPIDGIVSAWQIQRRLMDRPVTRGNALCSVVDPDGQWRLHLDIPDRDAGPILQAKRRESSGSQAALLPITFAVATQPEKTYLGSLQQISTAARLNPTGEQILDAVAIVESSGDSGQSFVSDNSRTGASVTAKIACGKRSIAASWFSDVVDFFHRHIAFYFR
jgi:multidrug efflux pump subunit AcrA (membrane-fusion protein)